jgi:hypothetical protein
MLRDGIGAVFAVRTGDYVAGGQIEIAVITKHEGFKWIRGNYYCRWDHDPEDQP